VTASQQEEYTKQQKLSPQQERELVRYTETLTERRMPPNREIIRNFASTVAKEPVSESWVTRFINRHQDQLTPRWTIAMDANCYAADSYTKYKL
jgi:hypothetical protein